MPTIGEINIDFYVFSLDTKSIIVGDMSQWNSAENKPAVISITPPGSVKPIKLNFAKFRNNGFNSNTLNLNCDDTSNQDLLDGVWTILLEASPSSFNKKRYYLKTTQTEIEIAKVYVEAGLEYQTNKRQLREDLEDIKFLIETAKSWTLLGDNVKAQRDFDMVLDLLRKYQKCKDCK